MKFRVNFLINLIFNIILLDLMNYMIPCTSIVLTRETFR